MERVDSEFDRKVTPFGAALSIQCSTPPSSSRDAVLRDISEGTRYCRVRLDYHPYAQVTQGEYTTTGCGPPPTIKLASPCPGVDHSASGLRWVTEPRFRGRPWFPAGTRFRFRFRFATHLNSLALASRRKTRHWLIRLDPTLAGIHFGGPEPFHALSACLHVVSGSFNSPPGVLFSVRSRY